MSNLEERIGLIQAALFDLMDISMQYMPPEGQNAVNQLGLNMNKWLDDIESDNQARPYIKNSQLRKRA